MKTTAEKAIESWLHGPIDPDTREEILSLQKTSPAKLLDAFERTLTFGTGGMRGIMGVGTNRINRYTVQMATQGLAQFLLRNSSQKHAVFIGFDSRHHSDTFAKEAALVLAGNGITAYLCSELRPTPFVSFGVRHLGCSAGIMITASHNPKEYNGYKVYGSDGGQVIAPDDKNIIEEVQKITSITQVKRAPGSSPLIQIVSPSLDEAYLHALKKFRLDPSIDKRIGDRLKIVYTPLHGTGIKLLPRALHQLGFSNIHLVDPQIVPNGDFPTVKSPNPESPEALALGIRDLEALSADLMIATDPDADRVAVAVRHKGKTSLLNGNQTAAICAAFICQSLKEHNHLPPNGALVTTIVSTDMIRSIAHAQKVAYFETLTGFKYIGALMRKWEEDHSYTFLFGAEESYGFLIGNHVHDKDAIAASCLIAEIALHLKIEGRTLIDYLHELYRTYDFFLEDQKTLDFPDGKTGLDKIDSMMEHLRAHPPVSFFGEKITWCIDYQKEETFLPKANVLLYRTEKQSKIVIRPSGTEPKLKIYAGIHSSTIDFQMGEQKLQQLLAEAAGAVSEKS